MAPKKMGRPFSDNPKNKTLRIRVDEKTIQKIDECSEALEITRSDVVRQGIDRIHGRLKKK